MSESAANRAVRRLQVGFSVALACAACLVVLDQVATHQALELIEADAHLINISGRQRMLGQRAAKEALLVRVGYPVPVRIPETLRQLEEIRRELAEAPGLPPALRARIAAHARVVAELETAVRAAAKGRASHLRLEEAASASLRSAEAITEDLEAHARAKQVRLRRTDWIGLGGTLVALAAMGWFVLVPLLRRVKATLQELDHTTREARAAAEARSRFVAGVSHELRTPLNGILGMSGFLERSDLSGRQRHYVEVIVSSARSLLALVNDILDFSKAHARQMVLEAIELDLVRVVEETLLEQAPLAARGGIDLFVAIDPALDGTVIGDPLRLRQCLANLTSNAIKFTSSGWVEVRVERQSGDLVRFEVSDTGRGVRADRAERIFEAFQQEDASTTREHGGTGLGLAITRRLALLMGGYADFSPREGGGSRFWFSARLPPERPETRQLGGAALLYGLPRLRRSPLMAWLRAWGVEPHVAETAEEAEGAARRAAADGRSLLVVVAEGTTTTPNELAALRDREGLEGASLALLVAPGSEHATRDLLPDNIVQLPWPLRRDALLGLFVPDAIEDEGDVGSALGRRVLLVDDNAINREIGVALLESMGCEVEIAEDGREALRVFEDAGPFDLVLMDHHMPVMDGLEATRALRSTEPGRAVPIVALTAGALDEIRGDCLDAGMNAVLGKPIDETLLTDILRSL